LFEAFACLVVIFWSPRISLAEPSRSSFAILDFLCAGEELLPLASDVDEGCQWKVQTDEGWTLYWDPKAWKADGWHSLLGQRECPDR
jgi:hypothetical protein